ncbi:folate-binding protein YgfZ [Curvibacter sp. CHRR-16]|uniref:CAF17-like 4Fe-4S cluster assembly/insertion protein YgfZ n=1 Tax=Curvibacter sp. CHRR-16 TaxID=2835872 RepID=UPI001BD93F84|nr:folate-binding protein [Curvibacter sp. CHRR-16]MBT0571240.1 folate-binding protein YgfZ [Curvibacter sp. CHRR-16]
MHTPALPDTLKNGHAALPHWGVLELRGADAAKFIHNQLTQDFVLLRQDQYRLAALCSPQGRMLGSFWGIKPETNCVLLIAPRAQIAPLLQRLRMFVLRAAVQLRDASSDWSLWGATTTQETSSTPLEKRGAGFVLHLPPAQGLQRQLHVLPSNSGETNDWPSQAMDTAWWDWLDVMSGIAAIYPETANMWVPQMLNYESVGGVNFKKGCYPGQEVVARSQFRGTLKRRAYLLQSEIFLPLASPVLAAGEEVGHIAVCAAHPTNGYTSIAVLQTSTENADLQAQNQGLERLPLPYKLLEDI